MADREDQSNLPPIPDGGLAESMPDWLRRPPAWRTLPDREVTVPEPEETDALPEPDDSVIDPRTFLSDEDLPEWLRNLGPGRGQAAHIEVAPNAVEVDLAPTGIDTRASDQPSPRVPVRFVPASPPVPSLAPSRAARETALRQPYRSQPGPAPARQGAWVVATLATALVVALVVIVLLVI